MRFQEEIQDLGIITNTCSSFSVDVENTCDFKKCCKKYKKAEKKRCKKCPKR